MYKVESKVYKLKINMLIFLQMTLPAKTRIAEVLIFK
jgi:hypothetical protein